MITKLLTVFFGFLLLTQAGAESIDSQRIAIQESLYIHTDRDLYIAGESLFFQLYLIPSPDYESPSGIAYITFQNQKNQNIDSIIVRLKNNIAYGSILLPDTLSTGNYRLNCFTNRTLSYGSQSHYSRPLFIVNRFEEAIHEITGKVADEFEWEKRVIADQLQKDQKITIETNGKDFGRREAVRFTIQGRDANDSVMNLSIAVAADMSFIYPHHVIPTSEGPEETFANADHHPPPGKNYFPEINTLILEGRILGEADGRPMGGTRVLLSTPDSLLNLQYAESFADGRFFFSINDFYIGKPLFLTLDSATAVNAAKIEISGKFDSPVKESNETPVFGAGHSSFIALSQQYVGVHKIFDINYRAAATASYRGVGFRSQVYGSPNITVYPGMFIPLDDFQEISRELISQLRIRRQRGNYSARLRDQRTASQFFERSPAIFLDAIPVSNIGDIMYLDSERTQRIEVHNLRWTYGALRFSGIISVFSHDEAYKNLILPETTLQLPAFSFLQPSVLNPPDYEEIHGELAHTPDFRQLLFWKPDIQLKSSEKIDLAFYTGDVRGRFLIRVEGFTTDGKKVSGVSEIFVK